MAKMESTKLNMCEKMFSRKLEVLEGSEVKKYQAMQYRDCLLEMAAKKGKIIKRMTLFLEGMEVFCRSKQICSCLSGTA